MSARRFASRTAADCRFWISSSFDVAAGEQVVLMGRSGCGKTTLLHVIAGISRPDTGMVRIDGCDITRLSEAGRDRFRADKIGYVFQTFNLLPGFSASRTCCWACRSPAAGPIRPGRGSCWTASA